MTWLPFIFFFNIPSYSICPILLNYWGKIGKTKFNASVLKLHIRDFSGIKNTPFLSLSHIPIFHHHFTISSPQILSSQNPSLPISNRKTLILIILYSFEDAAEQASRNRCHIVHYFKLLCRLKQRFHCLCRFHSRKR